MVQGHFAFENLLFEAFRARDEKKTHWADGLLHLVSHEQVPSVALHHQHSQYHLVLFWLENLFPQAAHWLGVRELARLALDFIENSPTQQSNPIAHAEQLLSVLAGKRAHLQVAKLEALMRCGLACWKLRSAQWRPDLSQLPRDKAFSLMTLIEHQQVAYVESLGEWSIFNLWQSAQSGQPSSSDGSKDVLLFFRKDELTLDFERWTVEQLKAQLDAQRV